MVGSFANAAKPSSGSWLDRWLQRRRRHPLAFACGVRVTDGAVAGERARWRYRDSALDPHGSPDPDGYVVLHHGPDVTLRLAGVGARPDVRTRPGEVVLSAVDAGTGANVQVSVPLGEVESFGVVLD